MGRFVTTLAISLAVVQNAAGPLAADEKGKDEALKTEFKRLEGKWRIVAAEQGGGAVDAGNSIVTFADGKSTIADGQLMVTFENTFTIDPSRNPKWMDVTSVKDKRTWSGIYEIKGDTMRAAFAAEKDAKRPTEFKTKKGTAEVMYTYERLK